MKWHRQANLNHVKIYSFLKDRKEMAERTYRDTKEPAGFWGTECKATRENFWGYECTLCLGRGGADTAAYT